MERTYAPRHKAILSRHLIALAELRRVADQLLQRRQWAKQPPRAGRCQPPAAAAQWEGAAAILLAAAAMNLQGSPPQPATAPRTVLADPRRT